jgi:hypothetical protein
MPFTSTATRLQRKPVQASPAQVQTAYEILKDLPHAEGLALRDFYLGNATKEEICLQLGVTPGEFRALRARIRAEFDARTA